MQDNVLDYIVTYYTLAVPVVQRWRMNQGTPLIKAGVILDIGYILYPVDLSLALTFFRY